MHPQKIALAILSVIGMFATFLPWAVTSEGVAIAGTAGAGWITSGVYLVIFIIIFTGSFRLRISTFSLVCIISLAILNSIYGILIINNMKLERTSQMILKGTSTGSGLYILIVTGFVLTVLGVLLHRRLHKTKPTEMPDAQQ
jgi:hypothetical protein